MAVTDSPLKSQPYIISNGVKQGAVISTPLFIAYINPLINSLQQCKQGFYIGYICANAFAYADDIVFLIPTCTALRYLNKICIKYAEDYKFKFNPDKCTLLIFLIKTRNQIIVLLHYAEK